MMAPAKARQGSTIKKEVGIKNTALSSKNEEKIGYIQNKLKLDISTRHLSENKVQYIAIKIPPPTRTKPNKRSDAPIFFK